MYFVLSPAKNLNAKAQSPTTEYTQPQLLEQSQQLIKILQQMAPHELAKLLAISDKLALLNTDRYHHWHLPFTPENATQAVYLFNGDVYTGLQASTLEPQALNYLQQHTAILSGLYGVLKPLDLIQPYRLEMGIKLVNDQGKDLYHFWGNSITATIKKNMHAVNDDVLINLASQEYFKSIQPQQLSCPIITPIFKDLKNGQYKTISFYAKRARGLFMRFAAENQLSKPEQLKDFDYAGYYFDEATSTEHEWVYLRDAH